MTHFKVNICILLAYLRVRPPSKIRTDLRILNRGC